MNRRQIVHKYFKHIDEITAYLRKSISSLDENVDLLELVENTVFNSHIIGEILPEEATDFIDCVYERLSNRFGILGKLLDNPSINEIMVNGPETIFVETGRHLELVDDAFTGEMELSELIRLIAQDVHREINEANPIVDARLPSGFRVNGVLKTVALNGPILTIRKFSEEEITMQDMIDGGSISEECASLLKELVNAGYNIFISGGTSSGKTTFLNALSSSINPDERVIIIEDSAELKISQVRNIVHMECRNRNSSGQGEISMDQLIKTSLRMRPDRIIVGEVRGKEVVDMIQAMNTGHQGSMSTGHGNSIKGMLNRLESMYLMDVQIPMYSVKSQIAGAIDIFVHLRRLRSGQRIVSEVAELVRYDGENYVLNYLYELNPQGKLVSTGNKLINDRLMQIENANSDERRFEL